MKVLDLNKMKNYLFMRGSLIALEKGDIESALSIAIGELTSRYRSIIERIDIALYVAKIYSEMGEFKACMSIMYRSLRYEHDEGRIFAMLAYNYYRAGDDESGDYYNALMEEWNEEHDGVLDARGYRKKDARARHLSLYTPNRRESETIDKAWEYAIAGDTKSARRLILSLDARYCYIQYELIIALDILDECHSIEASRMIEDIMSRPLDAGNVMGLFYTFDKVGNMEGILRIAEKAIGEKKCTARLAEIYATALLNAGRTRDALSILSRLDSLFGDVFPRIRALYYMANVREDLFAPIYKSRTKISDYEVARDEELVRMLKVKSLEDIIASRNGLALVYSLYEDGIVTDLTRHITARLMTTDAGISILEDMLLDVDNTSALMRIHIVRALIERRTHIRYVYNDVYVEASYTPPCIPLDDMALSKYKDEYTYMILSGDV